VVVKKKREGGKYELGWRMQTFSGDDLRSGNAKANLRTKETQRNAEERKETFGRDGGSGGKRRFHRSTRDVTK